MLSNGNNDGGGAICGGLHICWHSSHQSIETNPSLNVSKH